MRKLLLILLLLCLTISVARAQNAPEVQNTLIECLSGMPTDEIIGQTALCGELTVPENWQAPTDRTLALHYVVLKSPSPAPFPDPVIYLEGGPGASALVNVPFLAGAFAEIRRYRDVIIYDQRGTSFSTPLFCPNDVKSAPLPEDLQLPELPTSADPEIQALLDYAPNLDSFATTINCRAYFEAQGIDLSQYSTANSVRDLVALMTALDYAAYNIYGISYGTNVALELFRYYEDHADLDLPPLRTGIVDGVVPPNVDTRGGQGFISGYNILRVFADCEANAACGAAFPNIHQRAVDLMLQIAATPLTVGTETIEFEQLRHVLNHALEYKLADSGLVAGIGAAYLPLMISELEQGITTTYVGLRDDTLPAVAAGVSSVPGNPLAVIARESGTLAGTARGLANQLEQLERQTQRASAALASGLPVSDYFLQEVRIALNGLDSLTATFFPAAFDYLLATEHSRDNLASFASSLNADLATLVPLMSDADVEAAYAALAHLRPHIDSANIITLDVITCNDRFGSFDLESLFADFRAFEVPGLISKTDVAVNQKVMCTLWGLTPAESRLRPPVVTDLPIMVMNGSVDAETPVEWGEAAYDALTNAYFVTFAYFPHGSSTQFDCGPAVTAAFLLDPSRMPNTDCAADLQTELYPFVLSGSS